MSSAVTLAPDPVAAFLAGLHAARLEAIAVLRRILRQTEDDLTDPGVARRTREARLAATAILRVPLPKAPAPAAAPDPAPEDPPRAPTTDDDPSQARALARLEALRRQYISSALQQQQHRQHHHPAASAPTDTPSQHHLTAAPARPTPHAALARPP